MSEWFSESAFSTKFSKHQKSQNVRARKLKFWENVRPKPYVTCQVLYVRCQVSVVRCQVSRVRYHVSGETIFFWGDKEVELGLGAGTCDWWKEVNLLSKCRDVYIGSRHFERRFTSFHQSHVMCHMAYVTCHESHDMCHMLHVTSYFFWRSGKASRWRFCYQRGYTVYVFLYFKMFGVWYFFSFFLLISDLVVILWHTNNTFFLEEGGGYKTCTKVLSRYQKFACVAGTIFSIKKNL